MALNGPGEFVTLENVGSTDCHYRYRGSNHVLKSKSSKIVPWGHMDYLMGNPYFTEVDRAERLQQILARCGARRPEDLPYRLKATDADGDPITTIIEDPDGIYALHHAPTDELDPQAIRAALASLQRREKQLEEVMERALAAAKVVEDQADAAVADPAPDAPSLEQVTANARERALARASEEPTGFVSVPPSGQGEVGSDVISQVAPHLVPTTEVPTDAPDMTDVPTATPTA